jgi:protein-tyrosine phosphatase
MIHVVFVCLGNICRSPLAEGVFKDLVHKAKLSGVISVDSSATSTWEIGNNPDHRTLANAKLHGILLEHKAKQFTSADYEIANYVLVMDKSNLENIKPLIGNSPDGYAKVQLFRTYDSLGMGEVPDPYFGNASDFEQTYQIINRCAIGLFEHIVQQHNLV